MTNQEIYDLITCFENSSIHTMMLSREGFSLELSKGAASASPSAALPATSVPATPAPKMPQTDSVIKAPLVGAYYAAPAPDALPFVSVGDKVKKGQTVCLIEAMKMMNEITAPCDCTIVEILKENGSLTAFDEPLIRYQPC